MTNQDMPGSGDDAGQQIAREDELLELLYWFEGEGFGGVATLDGITRFASLAQPLVLRTLNRLIERHDVLLDAAGGNGPSACATSNARDGMVVCMSISRVCRTPSTMSV